MPFLFPGRSARGVRPNGPYVLNADHWQAQGLRVCLPMTGTPFPVDLVRRGQVDLAAGGGSLGLRGDPRAGQGWFRDGTQGSANLADPRTYSTQQLTVTAAVRAESTTSLMTFFARSVNTVNGGMWVFGLDSAGAWRWTTFESVQRNAVGPSVTTGQTTYLVGTLGPFDGITTNQFIYVNSPASSGSATTGAGMTSIQQDYGIGRRTDGGAAFNGMIFDLAVYDVEWKPTQVAQWLADPWAKYWVSKRVFFDIGAAAAARRASALLVPQAVKRASYF